MEEGGCVWFEKSYTSKEGPYSHISKSEDIQHGHAEVDGFEFRLVHAVFIKDIFFTSLRM